MQENTHLSDEKLVLLADGEVSAREESAIRRHLAECWSCRLRMRELDDAIAQVSRLHREDAEAQLPPADGPQALLRARLRGLVVGSGEPRLRRFAGWRVGYAAVLAGVAVLAWFAARPSEHNAIPRRDLTPGAVRQVAMSDVCGERLGDNAEVMPAMQRQVFAEYGMTNVEARAYEVDYLITPALGGSNDIHNLWPQPYAGSAWNAYVKDALEDRLRQMVCAGQLDLATAQHEIASDWVAAYKKYFRTNQPLAAHRQFRRD
jgi:predicted anti-sigma-YlaC factor YlaD